MATINLRPEVYDKASTYARKDKLNVDDWVNKILLRIIVDTPKVQDRENKSVEQKMYSWEELGGIFASDKSDKELCDEYLEEKYGI